MNETLEAGAVDRLRFINDTYFERRQQLSEFNKVQTEELEFALKGIHWKNESQDRDRPADRIQPVGRETIAALLHMAGDISSSEIYFDARPIDRVTDPLIADLFKQVFRWELDNPYKRYADIRDEVVLNALAGRLWCATVDFDPEAGCSPFGEVVPRALDGRMTGIPAGFNDPHDLKNPWWYEIQRLHPEEVRYTRGWKNNTDLRPDSDPIFPLQASPTDRGMQDNKLITVVRWWERDRSKYKQKNHGLSRTLKADQRYMACGDDMDLRNGCGFRSDSQGVLGRELPEMDRGACPDCAQLGIARNLQRIDSETIEEEYLQYPKGRLTCFQPGNPKPFYDDEWPQKTRSFPVLWFACRDYPGEMAGQSITSEYWTRQMLVNICDRVGAEHMMKALPYLAVPEDLRDANGEEWYGGEEQGLMVRYPRGQGKSGIEIIQAAGIPAGWPTLRREWLSSFERTQGTNDMPLDARNSRDIAVGTMEAFERIRSVPTEHVIQRLRRAESRFFPTWWDVLRDPSTNAEARLARFLGPDGQYKLQALRLNELPNFDMLVTTNPNVAKFAKQDVDKLVYVATQPRHIRRFVAQALNIPISQLNELEQEEAKLAATMPMQPPQPGQPPGAAGQSNRTNGNNGALAPGFPGMQRA